MTVPCAGGQCAYLLFVWRGEWDLNAVWGVGFVSGGSTSLRCSRETAGIIGTSDPSEASGTLAPAKIGRHMYS